MIKQFDVQYFSLYDFSKVSVGDPVFFSHRYGLEDICGKVVHTSQRREIVNVEFAKFHPLYKILKKTDLHLSLDLVHEVVPTNYKPRLVRDFVVYMNHGE